MSGHIVPLKFIRGNLHYLTHFSGKGLRKIKESVPIADVLKGQWTDSVK